MSMMKKVLITIISCAVFALPGHAYPLEKSPKAFFLIRKDGKGRYMHQSGQVAILPMYEDCSDFSENLAGVKVKKRWGFIDQTGKMVVQPQFDEVRWSYSEGLAAAPAPAP